MFLIRILFILYSFNLGRKLYQWSKEYGMLYSSILAMGFWLSGWIIYGFAAIIFKALGF